MRIAVDAMGGDNAPEQIILGVENARAQYPDIQFNLYGDEQQITALLQDATNVTIIPTTEIIEMGEEPVKAIRSKKDSSIVRAATDVKNGVADAFFSAGNTGAVMAAGLFIVGRIKGIDRPGLTSILPASNPNARRSKFVYLDSGANAEVKEKNLVQYAYLGKFYAQKVFNIDNPVLGLLNNGEEADKGDRTHKAVWQQLNDADDLKFIGNVEASGMLAGKVDVLVADGWAGNAALKATEGTAKTMLSLIRDGIMNGGLRSKLGYLLLKPVFNKIGTTMGTSTYGGAVLLGLKAPVVKTHGSSKADAVTNTIGQIKTMLDSNVIQEMVDYFGQTEILEKMDKSTEND